MPDMDADLINLDPPQVVLEQAVNGLAEKCSDRRPSQLEAGEIPKFSGKYRDDGQTFEEWLRHFNRVASAKRWSSQNKLGVLSLHLKDTALQMFETGEENKTFEQVIANMSEMFQPWNAGEIAYKNFRDRHQRPDESIVTFGNDINFMVREIPRISHECQQQIGIYQFLVDMPKKIRFYLKKE